MERRIIELQRLIDDLSQQIRDELAKPVANEALLAQLRIDVPHLEASLREEHERVAIAVREERGHKLLLLERERLAQEVLAKEERSRRDTDAQKLRAGGMILFFLV